MRLFGKRKEQPRPHKPWDPEQQTPAIRASICTGERVAGFMELETGKVRELMLIRDQKELEAFMRDCGVDHIDTIY